MYSLENLKKSIKNLNVLYIENSMKFRSEVAPKLDGLFELIYVAKSAQEGLELFKKYHSKVVIIDVDLSDFDWTHVASHILSVKPETKIILLTEHDEQKYLYDAIDLGITKFLKKPVPVELFIEAIAGSLNKIKLEQDLKFFYSCLHDVDNYQKSMIVMLEKRKPLMANQRFLDFFNVESVDEFTQIYGDLGSLFLEHDNFLYNKNELNWLDEISSNEDRIYHVSIEDQKKRARHFLLKYHANKKKDSYAILSFYDVSSLHFAEFFDRENEQSKKIFDDDICLFNLLELIHKNNIKVRLYNYYKGLSIINDATIEEVKGGMVTFKTDYMQQKAIELEGETLLSSEVLPANIICGTVVRNSFEKQRVKVKNIHFTRTSAATRKTIRLLPDDQHTVSLFINNNSKYKGLMRIADISLDSVKIKFMSVPTDIKINQQVVLDMVLSYKNRPLIINTKAVALKRVDRAIVFQLNLGVNEQNILLKYITNRQIDIIKEFKQLGKQGITLK